MDDAVRKEIKDRLREENPAGEDYDAVDEVAALRGRDPKQLHVKLTPPAEDSLARLMHLTRLGKTDITIRALQLYAFVEEERTQGAELLVRRGEEIERVHIL